MSGFLMSERPCTSANDGDQATPLSGGSRAGTRLCCCEGPAAQLHQHGPERGHGPAGGHRYPRAAAFPDVTPAPLVTEAAVFTDAETSYVMKTPV